jgi:hypothetical protein
MCHWATPMTILMSPQTNRRDENVLDPQNNKPWEGINKILILKGQLIKKRSLGLAQLFCQVRMYAMF